MKKNRLISSVQIYAEQIQVGLRRFEVPQIVNGVKVGKAGVVGDVEFREVKGWQQGLGDGVYGR